MDELESLLTLLSIPHLGSVKIRQLIRQYGSANQLLQTPLSEIKSFPGIGSKILQNWEKSLTNDKAKQDLLLAERFQTKIISYTDPLYPKRLLEIGDYPLVLYVQGDLLKQDQHCLSIVGTRHASLYGQEMAARLAKELAQAGFTIISGLARGIDTCAHKGAIESGRTVAVLGSGLACLYPQENKELARQITRKGAVLSEFSMTTPPDKQHFPQRNRIVSGMSLGTILIEAPAQSGAMLTAEKAIHQGRPVFALPGRVDHETFKGNHTLIKKDQARLIEGIEDILRYFDHPSLPLTFYSSVSTPTFLGEEENILLQVFPSHELSLEEIIKQLQWPVAKINVLLMSLVLKKVIKEYPGKLYKKIS